MQYETSKQVENFKQMLDSLHYDIRAILIKLADRLHNMRTLDSMRPEKQMKIAGETDYFYAPLANRLGLYGIRRELENLSLRYRCPLEYQELERVIEADKAEDRQRLDAFTGEMLELLRRKGIQARTEVRYRMPYSIWRKIQSTGRDFKHLDYRHVVRLIYPAEREEDEKRICLHIYSILTDRFKENRAASSTLSTLPKRMVIRVSISVCLASMAFGKKSISLPNVWYSTPSWGVPLNGWKGRGTTGLPSSVPC